MNPLKKPDEVAKAKDIATRNKYPQNLKGFEFIVRPRRPVWLLGFKRGKLGRVQIKDDTGTPENFWFLAYELKNNDKYDHEFFLHIRATTDRDIQGTRTYEPSFKLDNKTMNDRDKRLSLIKKRRFHHHDTYVEDVYEHLTKKLRPWLRKKGEPGYFTLLNKKNVSMPPPNTRNRTPPAPVGSSFDFRNKLLDPDMDREFNRLAEKLQRSGQDANPSEIGGILDDLDKVYENMRHRKRIALPVIKAGQTLKCVAIFPGSMDPEMDHLIISIRGLTNASLLKRHRYSRPKGKPHRRVIKEAVLELHYKRPGDEFHHDRDAVVFMTRKWVDVQRTIKSDLASKSE